MLPKKFMLMTIVVVTLFIMVAVARGTTPGRDRNSGAGTLERVLNEEEGCGDACDTTTVVFLDGNTGNIDVPLVGAIVVDVDAKHHFDVPEEVGKVEVTFTWNPHWNLVLDIGTGECPHNGETLVSETSNGGNITLVYESADNLPVGKWFAHLSPVDASTHRGESCAYTISAVFYDCVGECESCEDSSSGSCSGECD